MVFGRGKRSNKERRRHTRKPVGWSGYVEIGGTGTRVPFTVTDISRGGARFEIEGDGALEQGDEVLLTIERMGTTTVSFMLAGAARRVVRTPSGVSAGVEVRDVDRQTLHALKSIFDSDA